MLSSVSLFSTRRILGRQISTNAWRSSISSVPRGTNAAAGAIDLRFALRQHPSSVAVVPRSIMTPACHEVHAGSLLMRFMSTSSGDSGDSEEEPSSTKRLSRKEQRDMRLGKTAQRQTSKSTLSSSSASNPVPVEEGDTQHLEWVQFQKSISVDGFNTGQVTDATDYYKARRATAMGGKVSKRGGKRFRKKREKERMLREWNEPPPDLGGGHVPALRYDEAETQRLLAEAYANIPPRAGKRGTRNLKRQRLRFKRIRKEHRKQKQLRIQTHERRMAKRHRIHMEVRAVKEHAKEVVERDRVYQREVLREYYMRRLQLAKEEGEVKRRVRMMGGVGGGDVVEEGLDEDGPIVVESQVVDSPSASNKKD